MTRAFLCYGVLSKNTHNQEEMEFVAIGALVPQDHLLRKIDRHIDFSFIYQKVESLYCGDNGQPSLDPVVLFKILFIGYLFGIRSERQLMREIEVNVAYRWFLGFGLQTKIPHHSTISFARNKRFAESSIYQDIFDEIVLLGLRHRLIEGQTLHTDSTHLKASANKNKYDFKDVTPSTKSYLEELEKDVTSHRQQRGKKPLRPKDNQDDNPPSGSPQTKEIKTIKVSPTDPDSGYMIRDGKPKGFFYLDHRTVDDLHSLITDVHVTAGNVHDSVPYLERLDRQLKRFGLPVKHVALDAGYFTASICKVLSDRDLYGCMPYTRPMGKKGMLKKNQFVYDEHYDCYLCPQDQVLSYATTSREGYAQYRSNSEICRSCPLLSQCTTNRNATKTIARHVWEHHKERVVEHRYEEKGKRIYARRKECVERSFADAKELHGHRYARLRGLKKAAEQCLLAAASQNMKKIALLLSRGAGVGGTSPSVPCSKRPLRVIWRAIGRRIERQLTKSPLSRQFALNQLPAA